MGAGNVIKPMKAPVATAWVTAADISGTGTAIVASAIMAVIHPNVDMFDYLIEIEFTAGKTAGAGTVRVWAHLPEHHLADKASSDGGSVAALYTTQTDQDTSRNRRIHIKPLVLSAGSSSNTDRTIVYVRARGTDASTELSVTNIRARLIYVPL